MADLFIQAEAAKIGLPDGTKLFELDYDQDDDENCLTWDFTFAIPSKDAADSIYMAISECSASMCFEELTAEDHPHESHQDGSDTSDINDSQSSGKEDNQ